MMRWRLGIIAMGGAGFRPDDDSTFPSDIQAPERCREIAERYFRPDGPVGFQARPFSRVSSRRVSGVEVGSDSRRSCRELSCHRCVEAMWITGGPIFDASTQRSPCGSPTAVPGTRESCCIVIQGSLLCVYFCAGFRGLAARGRHRFTTRTRGESGIRRNATRSDPRTGSSWRTRSRSHLSQTQREFGPSTQHVGAVWQLAVSETNGAALARSIIAALG